MPESTRQVISKDRFPTVTGTGTDGGRVALPAEADGSWSVLLFYRGHW